MGAGGTQNVEKAIQPAPVQKALSSAKKKAVPAVAPTSR
jgi:hypothetical protein